MIKENNVGSPQHKPRLLNKKQVRNLRENILLWVLRIAFGIVFAFPLYWAVITSFRSVQEIVSPEISLGIKEFTTMHYKNVLMMKTPYGANSIFVALINTLVITIIGGVINIAVSSLAGYAFAKLKFKGHKTVFKVMIMSMMIPGIITIVPTFLIISWLGLWGNLAGVIVPGALSVFNIFFMRQFFIGIPDELGESAEIDGASEMLIFRKIYLPQVKPALAAIAIFNFQGGWNNFLLPYVILPDRQLVLATFIRTIPAANFGESMAASMLVTLPVFILFVIFQKYFMTSVTFSGVEK